MTTKLLVNTPSGKQDVINIGPGGGYFDAVRVIWDERTDGDLPAITLGGMVRNGSTLEFSQARMDEHNAALTPPVPQEVPGWALKIALVDAGFLDEFEAYIPTITPAAQRKKVEILWDRELIQRGGQVANAMKDGIPRTNAQLDQLFIDAKALITLYASK